MNLIKAEKDDKVFTKIYNSHFDEVLATVTEALVLRPVTIEELVREKTPEVYCTEFRSCLN